MQFPDSKTRRGRVIDGGETSPTLDTGCEIGIIQVGNIAEEKNFSNPQCGRVYDPKGIAPALNTMQGGAATTKDNREAMYHSGSCGEEADRQKVQR